MVQVNGLSVWMGRRPILRDINLAVSPGESIAIMGPNGAGKSTLLLCLAGVIRPTLGRICCFREATPRSSTAKRLTGFAGHQSGLYGDLTALENLTFAARMYEIDDPINKAHASLSEAGIGPQAGYRVAQLSQGARQRLAIIRSAIHQPFLILLDEPFASLDADGSQWLQLLFQRWRDTERTVCFVSHDIEKSRRLADRIVWLDAGHITSIDECKTMFSHSLSVA